MWKSFFSLLLLLNLILGANPAESGTPADSTVAQIDTLTYELEEVVVTGTRYEKKIIDIPYSIIRVDNRDFQHVRKVGADDVLNSVPGMFLQSRYGNHDVRISIRGFGSRSNSGIRGVRILLDGIPESEPDGQTRIEAIDFNSVGRIEIVKGNASSLYPNAPGGVVNFLNDIYFPSTFAVSFNDVGSFGLHRNGFKAGVRTSDYAFLLTYSRHSYSGYRQHSDDAWHIVNTVLETTPNQNTNLEVLGYFVDGRIRLPGSLTRQEYNQDSRQAAQREVDFDFSRMSKKGRVGLRFTWQMDRAGHNELQLTSYGTIKYFERTSRVFKIINRWGLGASMRYVHMGRLFGRQNEFSLGGDFLHQTGPIELYKNINGKKSDALTGLTNEAIGNRGFFFQNSLDLWRQRLNLLVTGRYDQTIFDQKNQLLAVQNDRRVFQAFTPKLALNYKLTPAVAIYSSYGLSFDSPAGNELDNYPLSNEPGKMLNPDLQPQKVRNFELGVKGNQHRSAASFLNQLNFETTVFQSQIRDEVVPFEVFNDVYYRNSARTRRRGLEVGASAELLHTLNLQLAYTFSDFIYRQYEAQTIEIGSSGDIVTGVRNFSGNRVPSIPRHNLMVSLSHAQHISRHITGFLRGSQQYVSGLYVDDANSGRTAGYRLWNLTTGLDMVFGHFNCLLSLGVNNLLDETYVGFVNINSTTGRFYEAGSPRTFFGSLKLGYSQ